MPAFVLFTVFLCALGAYYTVKYTARQVRYRRLLRQGRRLTGEVVDVDTRRRAGSPAYYVKPIVAYTVADREYRSIVVNRKGMPPLGEGMDLVLDERRPQTPYAVDRSTFVATLVNVAIIDLIAVGLIILAVRASR